MFNPLQKYITAKKLEENTHKFWIAIKKIKEDLKAKNSETIITTLIAKLIHEKIKHFFIENPTATVIQLKIYNYIQQETGKTITPITENLKITKSQHLTELSIPQIEKIISPQIDNELKKYTHTHTITQQISTILIIIKKTTNTNTNTDA